MNATIFNEQDLRAASLITRITLLQATRPSGYVTDDQGWRRYQEHRAFYKERPAFGIPRRFFF
jgi:hypothetical protein